MYIHTCPLRLTLLGVALNPLLVSIFTLWLSIVQDYWLLYWTIDKIFALHTFDLRILLCTIPRYWESPSCIVAQIRTMPFSLTTILYLLYTTTVAKSACLCSCICTWYIYACVFTMYVLYIRSCIVIIMHDDYLLNCL